MQIAWLTEPATGSVKGNEDVIRVCTGKDRVRAAVCDGVTQLRDEEGVYPLGRATEAAVLAARHLSAGVYTDLSADLQMHDAFAMANASVHNLNVRLHLTQADGRFRDRAGATAVATYLKAAPDGSLQGAVGAIGDTLALLIAPTTVTVLSRDQLAPVHSLRQHFASSDERLFWHRTHARNRPEAYDAPSGQRLGYGVINGEPAASCFWEVTPVTLPSGSRLLLASDALRVCSTADHPDDPLGYASLANIVRDIAANDDVPHVLIAGLRKLEELKGCRSDDASIVCIQAS